ncbi:hypothetical protein LCGC14_1307870 [marine sediment metagenome]|uniref:Peptidase S74 domain-containing protein n=1 Tax=marine sediment metagenome TaxID=412755 RepID=A0A0F9KN90_9ZZZZ
MSLTTRTFDKDFTDKINKLENEIALLKSDLFDAVNPPAVSGGTIVTAEATNHAALSGVAKDQHHAKDHQARHNLGGADPLNHDDVDNIDANNILHINTNEKNHFDFFNSTIAQQFDFKVTSDGSIITGSLEKTGGGDLTMRFVNDEYILLDCTPAKTVIITQGADDVPVHRHYYILQSAPTIITEALDWPSAEHIQIAKLNIPSAAYIQTKNVYSNQNINNDHSFVAGDLSGGYVHLSHKIRESIGATYPQEGGGLGGGAGGGEYLDVSGGTTVRFKMDVGTIMQMHDHTFNAIDTSAGDVVLVRNFSGTAWNDISNIYDIINDSLGGTINNRYFNLEVIAIASKEKDYVMINVPSGSYATLAQALEDKDRFDDTTIPLAFKGVATPICRMTIRKAASAWVVHQIDDQRGINVAAFTGATVSGGYSDVDVEAYVSSVANAPIATGDSLVFTDVGSSGVLKQDLVSDLLVLAIAAVEANANVFTTGQAIETINTHLRITETDAAADEKKWIIDANAGRFRILTENDAGGSFTNLLSANRVGNTINWTKIEQGDFGVGMTPTVQLELSKDEGQKPSTNTWTITPSGRDFKQDIEDYTQGLATLMNIRPVQFKYKQIYDLEKTHDMEKTHVGIIAEEMEIVVPSTIGMGKRNYNHRMVDTGLIDDETKEPIIKEEFDTVDSYTYNSHDLTYIMINAIKELKQENDDMRARLNILEGAK